jgi:hypothetical protein
MPYWCSSTIVAILARSHSKQEKMNAGDRHSEIRDFPAYLRESFRFAIARINKDGLLPDGLGFDSVVVTSLLRYAQDRSVANYEEAEGALEDQIAGVHQDG